MAFSTQNEFFHVPFLNEDNVEFECRKACVNLKSYDSTIDNRAWALDDTKQSRFLSDLVTCKTPVLGLEAAVDQDCRTRDRARRKGPDKGPGGGGAGGGPCIQGGDSLLTCAKENFEKLECILLENKRLQKNLEVSHDRLQCATNENEAIKAILTQKFDKSIARDFLKKIQKMSACGGLDKCDEKDLLDIYTKIEQVVKAYEVVTAQNSMLKRLVEKLSTRATMCEIKIEQENSCDICYLQEELNCTRRELAMLRQMEDEMVEYKICERDKNPPTDRDAQNIRDIIKERDNLRGKCRNFENLQEKVIKMQCKLKEDCIISTKKSKYISELERELKCMEEFYELEISKYKMNEEVMTNQCHDMDKEINRSNCLAKKIEDLEMELTASKNEILRLSVALKEYENQYKRMMYHIKMFKRHGYHICDEGEGDEGAGHKKVCNSW